MKNTANLKSNESDEPVNPELPVEVESATPSEPAAVVKSIGGDVRQQIDLTTVEDSDAVQRLIERVQHLIKIASEHIDTASDEVSSLGGLAKYEKIYPSLFREKYNSDRAKIINTYYGKAFTCLREALWDISYLATDEAQSIKNQIAQAYNRFVRLYEEDIKRQESGHGHNSDRINPKIEQYLFLVSYANQKRDTPCNNEDASIKITKQFLNNLLRGYHPNEVYDGSDPVKTAYDLLRETKASNSSTAQLLIRQRAVEYLESKGMGVSEKEIDGFKKSHPPTLKNED